MENIEYIGKVKLNYRFYSGKDEYSDGPVEDELLQIVRETPPEEFDRVIRERKSWPILYHLSKSRENIIRSVSVGENEQILEIGAGCGAVTGELANKAPVTCIDLSKKRSLINAYRNRDKENIEILVGNFADIEKELPQYDVITLIGVLEYAALYIQSDNADAEFLRLIRKHLKKNGRIYIAIENRFGLKYWAGCQEDHLGGFFRGIEGYEKGQGVHTYGRSELEKLICDSGYKDCFFYYPYPDYKFPSVIYSDEYLPHKGELMNNNMNFDRDKVFLFEESKVYDSIIDEKEYPFFANSFLVEAWI